MSPGGNWRMSRMKYDERQARDAQTTEGGTELGNWIWTLQRLEVCLYAEFQQCQFILYFDSNWSLSSGEGRIEEKASGCELPTPPEQGKAKANKHIFARWPWSLKLTNIIYPPLHYDLCSLILEYVAPWPLDVHAISNLSEKPDSHLSLVVLSVGGNEKVL